MTFIIGYLFFCVLVGWGYSKTTWGFGGGFLFSLLLSPLLGFIVMFFVPEKKDETVNAHIMLTQQRILQQQLDQSKPQHNLADELTKLENLKDKKLITDDEYKKMREKLMKDFV